MLGAKPSVQPNIVVGSIASGYGFRVTLEQLRIFLAVADREHMTRAAEALHLTQSAVSSAISALEVRHATKLFHRPGRGVTLTDAGRALALEARAILDQVGRAELMLAEFEGMARGTLRVAASQTIGGYWLPPRLHALRVRHPGVQVSLDILNSEGVAERVLAGTADLGFVEGEVTDPMLDRWVIGEDQLALVAAAPAPGAVDAVWLRAATWVLREEGSGTRSTFEAVLHAMRVAPDELRVALVLPSNEAVRTAAEAGAGAAVLSTLVVASALAGGTLHALPLAMPPRRFFGLRHRQRYQSRAAEALLALIAGGG